MTKELQVPDAQLERIFCVAWDESTAPSEPARRAVGGDEVKSRLFVSDDYFKTRQALSFPDLPNPRGFTDLGASRHFLVSAVLDPTLARQGEMRLYVSRDAISWTRAAFPHAYLTHESGYTVVEGPKYHLMVNLYDASAQDGALFISDGSGQNFTRTLMHTRRTQAGLVDYEHLANIEGVAIVNVREPGLNAPVQTKITHDEGASWRAVPAPAKDVDGRPFACGRGKECSLHLHSLLELRNVGRVFSSTAPGLVMGVGSVGEALKPYDQCDTFLSTDAGVTWTMVARHPHKHVFGDQGGLVVMVEDAPQVQVVKYSFDYGRSWATMSLPAPVEPVALTTAPDGTALKVLLIGTQRRGAVADGERYMAVFIDFAVLAKRTCHGADFEKFYATAPGQQQCLMGHRQWYKRRKAQADCFVRKKFHEPQGKEEPCDCTPADFECDIHFARNDKNECVPTGALIVPPGACSGGATSYLGPSGYRKIPGDTCLAQAGFAPEKPVSRPCSEAQPLPSEAAHARFEFPAEVAEVLHFHASPHILARLKNGQVFQSADDGSTWDLLPLEGPGEGSSTALLLVSHAYDRQRAFIITAGRAVHYTSDGGVHWEWWTAPLEANALGLLPLGFHPRHPTWLLWTGSRDCVEDRGTCHAEVWYSTAPSQGRWQRVDSYVRQCAFLATKQFSAADETIVCESYAEKTGSQLAMSQRTLDLVVGERFYRTRKKVATDVLGFSVLDEFMLVAQVTGAPPALRMLASLDGYHMTPISLPPSLALDHRAYTVLDSVTRAVFLHVTTSNTVAPWGTIAKSNSNATYYTTSLERVNRDEAGYVDFEKMLGLDGIALANVVANPDEASVSGTKLLRSMITHNDGGHWKPVVPPPVDSNGVSYECTEVGCDLHVHNLLERPDVRVSLSSPAAAGFMLATGNVGRSLLPYRECDTFLTRDGGFTWEEVHKGTHKWEYGDHGSIIVLVDDTQPTDVALYTLDQGLTWQTYQLGDKITVSTIDTVPEDTQRKFVLFGESQGKPTAIFLDFSQLLSRACEFHLHDEPRNDFERWSPSEQREEACLFGTQTWFWRRKRDRQCYVGGALPIDTSEKYSCACTEVDFECEFNHYRDPVSGQCVLHDGAQPLPNDEASQCRRDAPEYDGYWYERTNVRKIPLSQCSGGPRPDRGRRHRCSAAPASHGFLWWIFVLALAGVLGLTLASWVSTQSHGAISLRGIDQSPLYRDARDQLRMLGQFVGGLAMLAWANVQAYVRDIPWVRSYLRRYDSSMSSYHMLSTDEDAEILRDYDSDLEA